MWVSLNCNVKEFLKSFLDYLLFLVLRLYIFNFNTQIISVNAVPINPFFLSEWFDQEKE
jgi:hypothetical protein